MDKATEQIPTAGLVALRASVSSPTKQGRLWHVVIVQAGPSLNGFEITDEAVREAAPLFAGLPVFEFSTVEGTAHVDLVIRPDKASLSRQRVGQVESSVFVPATKDTPAQAVGSVAIDDTRTRARLLAAWERGALGGARDVEGLSIDVDGEYVETPKGRVCTRLRVDATRGHSLDIVTQPAAGGAFRRLVACVQQGGESAAQEGSVDPELVKRLDALTASVAQISQQIAARGQGEHAEQGLAHLLETVRHFLATLPENERKAACEALMQACGMSSSEHEHGETGLAAKVREALVPALATVTGPAREAVQRALELVPGAANTGDARDAVIEALHETIRAQTLAGEIGRLSAELRIRDVDAATRLVDPTRLQFSEDGLRIEGVREALAELCQHRPWLVTPEEAEPRARKTPAHQAVPVRESAPAASGSEVRPLSDHDVRQLGGGDVSPLIRLLRAARSNREL